MRPEGRTSDVREIGEREEGGLQRENTEEIRCDSQAGLSWQRLRHNVNMCSEKPVILK